MAQKSSDKRGEKDDTDRSLFARFVEGVVVFCICGVVNICAVFKPTKLSSFC